MKTPGPTSGLPPLPTGTQRPAPVWQPGQLLQATVSRSPSGQILLQIGHRQVVAETSLPLRTGQQLSLRVQELEPLPVLRILSRLPQDPVAAATRELLPRQAPVAPLLAALSALTRAPQPLLPPLVAEAARHLLRQLPDAGQLGTLGGLKRALQNAGAFLEPHLRQAAAQPESVDFTRDLKANLIRLLHLLRNTPAAAPARAPAPRPPAADPAQFTPAPPAANTGGGRAFAPATPPTPATATAPAATQPPASRQPAENPQTPKPQPGPPTLPPQRLAQVSRPAPPASGQTELPTSATPASGNTPPASPTPPVPAAVRLAPPLPGTPPQPQVLPEVVISAERYARAGELRSVVLQHGEAALARLHLSQLAALPKDGERGLIEWLFELPVRRGDDIDVWSLRIFGEPEGDKRRQGALKRLWTAQLAFDLPGLGAVQAQVLWNGKTVSTRFWARRADTVPVLESHLHELRRSLAGAGLEVADIECRQGELPMERRADGEPLIREQV